MLHIFPVMHISPLMNDVSNNLSIPVDMCTFKTGYRKDGSRYVYKESDCGETTCRYSTAYIPPDNDD